MIKPINDFIGQLVELRLTFGFGSVIHCGTVERYDVTGTDPVIAIENEYHGKILLVDGCDVTDCGKYLMLDMVSETSLQKMHREHKERKTNTPTG
jgi:hypothetical protein